MEELYKELSRIQKELKAPKNQVNNFGKYKYRSCSDILEAVKPLITNGFCVLLSDEIIQGNRTYIKATATFSNGKDKIEVTSFARESDDKKGMDVSQITGAASSYARKYALNGLFAIDDTKDTDSEEYHAKSSTFEPTQQPKSTNKEFDYDYL